MTLERLAHRIVEAWASQTPDAVAAVWDGGTLTYREFDETANRFANLLLARGVAPESLVSVSMDPSPTLLVAMVAVWKAGGVYVPIDPSLPGDVADGMLADAGIDLLIRNGPVTASSSSVEMIDLDGLDLSGQLATAPEVGVVPDNLAYCVFTSGSTGKPKLVAVTHSTFTNHAPALRDQLGLGSRDRVLQSTAIAFDAALEEILPAWAAGAAVVMPAARRFTSWELTELINRLSVTMVSQPSAFWHQWVDDLAAGLVSLPDCLRVVFIGGDKILVDKLAAWYRLPGAERINWVSDYGPTETTISVALHHPAVDGMGGALSAESAESAEYALVPIGRSFAGAELTVRDSDLRPVPDGEAGDLWVGGPVLARGYHAAPALTAERFRPDPQGPAGSRMYHTGDRALRGADGLLVFLGRSDRQVKIRGQRVEPGQVESALHYCAGVKDAVVIVREDPRFGVSLAAYVEAEPGVSEESIRAGLTRRLPEAMVPTAIVLLDRIPRSPLNGKIARSALPPIGGTRVDPPTEPEAMSTLERVIASLIGEVIGVAPRDRHEDFFAAGGDSLRAMQVLNRVAVVTGVALTFQQLRAAPHVAGIAARVRQTRAEAGAYQPMESTAGDGDRRPASRGQYALWFLDQVHQGAPLYSVPVCYRIRGPLDLDRFDAALTEIVARHEALRTVLETADGKVWQRIKAARPVMTEVIDVADREEASRRAQDAAEQPFDLRAGPLLRSTCFRVDDREYLWLLNVHHAVFDAWSLGVFWQEITGLYNGRPQLPVRAQYADYAAWQQRWLRGPEADKQRAYWRARLAGTVPAIDLGSRRAGRRVGSEGFTLELAPGAVDPAAVAGVARAHGTTPFVVLLAAFGVALRRTGAVDEVVVGVPVACRNRPETENLIGYLVNTVSLRLRFSAGMRFRDVIAHADATLAEALTHQDLPFADAVADAVRGGLPGENPVFQAMFAFQSTPLDGLDGLDGLDIVEQFVHSRTAKTALTWSARQDASGVAGEIEYAADRFDQTSAARWRDALLAVLGAVLAEPNAVVDELPVPVDAVASEHAD